MDYVPNTNRWLSPDTIVPDPANPQSFNRYSYVENNPINFSDPTGHCKNGRGTGPDTCQVVGGPDVSIGTWRWYNEVAPRNGVQTHAMTTGELEFFIDTVIRENVPDAYGIGVSASASIDTPLGGVEGNIGREEVFDPDTRQRTTFLVVGGDISIGPNGGFIEWTKRLFSPDGNPSPINASVSPYYSAIYNVDDVVADYSGTFIYDTTTAAYEYGATWGEAYSPNDPNRNLAHSTTSGLAFGYALTTNHGANYYIPIKTHNPGQLFPTFHNPLPYLGDLASILFGD